MSQETRQTAGPVLVTGGSGFIGRHLVSRLRARGNEVIVLSRRASRVADRFGPGVRVIDSLDALPDDLVLDAIVNLAGAPIFGLPWTAARRRVLRESRLRTTAAVVALCGRLLHKPKVLVSASGVGFYGIGGAHVADETEPPQDIFQSQLCLDWELAARRAEAFGIRVVRLRFGIVLGKDGGALPPLALPLRLGVGTILGDGTQVLPWIHIEDALGLITQSLDDERMTGGVNAVAPHATSQREFMQTLGRVLHRPVWLRVPAVVLRLMLGEMAQLFVEGRAIMPAAAQRLGYTFRHPRLEAALAALFG